MDQQVLHKADGSAWKELAQKMRSLVAGPAVTKTIARMNELVPFSSATGILDNGCGAGSVIACILEDFGSDIPPSARVIASDYSTDMLEQVRQRKQIKLDEGHAVWDKLEIVNLDAHDLSSIPSGTMTHITGGHVYFLLADPRKALKEAYRVLSENGVIGLTSGKSSQHIDALQDAVEHVRPGTKLRLLKESWASEESVKNELSSTGFTNTETFVIETEMKYSTHRDFAKTLLLMPVMKDAMETYNEGEKRRLLESLVTNLCSANPLEPGTVKGASIVAVARKS